MENLFAKDPILHEAQHNFLTSDCSVVPLCVRRPLFVPCAPGKFAVPSGIDRSPSVALCRFKGHEMCALCDLREC
jgi:hypothetical protein